MGEQISAVRSGGGIGKCREGGWDVVRSWIYWSTVARYGGLQGKSQQYYLHDLWERCFAGRQLADLGLVRLGQVRCMI